jgi:hypothetical protein
MIRKTKNIIRAIPAALAAMPPKPKSAATSAIGKNTTASQACWLRSIDMPRAGDLRGYTEASVAPGGIHRSKRPVTAATSGLS